jgi:hypothetical protein
MLTKLQQCKMFLMRPDVMLGLKIAILVTTLMVTLFAANGVSATEPGWGGVGG